MFASPMVLSFDASSVAARHPTCIDMVKNVALLSIARDSGGMPRRLVHQATNASAAPANIRTSNTVEQIFERNVTDTGGGIVVKKI